MKNCSLTTAKQFYLVCEANLSLISFAEGKFISFHLLFYEKSRSGDILKHLLGLRVKLFGAFYDLRKLFKSGGVGVAVGDALVAGNAEIDVPVLFDAAVVGYQVFLVFLAEGEEYGDVAEIIKMVIYRRDAERAHRGYGEASVEGRKLREFSRKKPEIVEKFEIPHRPF